jgi:anti-sigma factor RsiW
MKHKFTPEDFIAFLYHETSTSDRLAMEAAIHSDPALAAEMEGLRRAKDLLPAVKFNAGEHSLQRVLSYSRSTALERQV